MIEQTIDVVFDGPPGPQSGSFVEVERDKESISIGEWVDLGDGLWALRIPDPAALEAKLEAMNKLAWAVRMVLRDFDDNDSPELSVAAVQAIESVRKLAAQQEKNDE